MALRIRANLLEADSCTEQMALFIQSPRRAALSGTVSPSALAILTEGVRGVAALSDRGVGVQVHEGASVLVDLDRLHHAHLFMVHHAADATTARIAGRQRPRNSRAAQQRNELAP